MDDLKIRNDFLSTGYIQHVYIVVPKLNLNSLVELINANISQSNVESSLYYINITEETIHSLLNFFLIFLKWCRKHCS